MKLDRFRANNVEKVKYSYRYKNITMAYGIQGCIQEMKEPTKIALPGFIKY